MPEFPGAMENPGCVTLGEQFLFRSRVTDTMYQVRAEVILHEMAHMWFGDLVTMRWWDDLWLNESFAECCALLASAEATRFTGAWTTFSGGRKNWGYMQDQLPSAHPVAANAPTLTEAAANFDGISYAKGASHAHLLGPYADRYFEALPQVWATRDEGGPGSFRLAFGHLLFPYPLASPELLARIDAFLSEAARYQDLARVVTEGRDVVERALRSRALPDRP